jgi:phenylalanine-4-hydroxylase
MSTQYIRHHSVPSYTPEPDVIHEVIGHANQLAAPTFAAIYRGVGDAVRRVSSDAAVQFLSRVFWFTIEFGVVWEAGRLKAYGAGILSSFGELEAFADADVRPFELAAMGTQPYDITKYQPVLFAADSVDALAQEMTEFLAGYDDDAFARLTSRRIVA